MESLGWEKFPLFFSQDFKKNDFQILEVDTELLNKIWDNKVSVNANMCVKDPQKHAAVLVSDTDSYKIQKLGKFLRN